jgi:hypothetical protein
MITAAADANGMNKSVGDEVLLKTADRYKMDSFSLHLLSCGVLW